jgi:hypothetical protein
MSETKYLTGTLTPIVLNENETLEERAEKICKEADWEPYDDESWLDVIKDDGYRAYFVFNNSIYGIEYDEHEDNEDIFDASKNEDGIIDFTLKYYNGGCGFNEALEYAISDLEKEKDK